MIYQEFKETVIGIAQEMGIADYELYYTEGDSVSVEIYQEEVKGYSVEDDLGVCFRCVVDGKAGYASTENLTEEEARSLVVRALDNAESIESEEEVFLHEKGDTYAVCPHLRQAYGRRADRGGAGAAEEDVSGGSPGGGRHSGSDALWQAEICLVQF